MLAARFKQINIFSRSVGTDSGDVIFHDVVPGHQVPAMVVAMPKTELSPLRYETNHMSCHEPLHYCRL